MYALPPDVHAYPPSTSTKSVEHIVGWPMGIFCDSFLLRPHNDTKPDGATWDYLILRPGWSRLITSSSVCSGWSRRLSLRMWNLLRVCAAVRGHIATCSGLCDLLLGSHPFNSRFQSWGWLSWREHHSLQQLFDGVDGLVGLFHHSLKLCLSTCHLGEVDPSVRRRLLFFGPLGRIRSLSLVLTLIWLILGQVLGTSPPRHYGWCLWLTQGW